MSEKPFTPSDSFDWESSEDLTALPEPELEELLTRVIEEERLAAYRRELMRGRANLIRAELAGRGVAGLSTEELARVLLGEEGEVWPA